MPHQLLLVRHSQPQIQGETPAREWRLSAEGYVRAEELAAHLAATYYPATIISSVELKARETAACIAARFHMPVQLVDGLHEHERQMEPFREWPTFEALVSRFFAQPEELVLGSETATQAQRRFTTALHSVLARSQHQSGDVVVVTHGTVMALYVAARLGIEPFPFWQNLKLPDYVALPLPVGELMLSSVGDGDAL